MSAPKRFSAYEVVWSDEPAMPVGAVLIEKGDRLERDWNTINFETGDETAVSGRRLVRLCPDCRVEHNSVGVLGHDGDCGTEEAKTEARQEIRHAKKAVIA